MNLSYTSSPPLPLLNNFSSFINSRRFLSLYLSLHLLLLDLGFVITSGFEPDSALRFRVAFSALRSHVVSYLSRSSTRIIVWVARGGRSGITTTLTNV